MSDLPVEEALKKFLQSEEKSSIGHVWNMREDLKGVLHQDTIWSLLEKCFKSKLYLNEEKGVKLLAWVIEHGLKHLIHQTVKSQLRICSLKDAETYGKIYFKAWMGSEPSTRKELEDVCLQDLINMTIHFNRKSNQSVFSKLCKFLNCFHKKKTAFEVNGMLIRIYEPIIWRSLKVANASVRGNAAYILYDIFPLGNPNDNMEQAEIALVQQYKEMKALLEDPVPEVRCIAALGMFKSLKNTWENIPNTVIRQWLETLLNKCLHDGNCSKLRYNVIRGLTNLVSNPLCHQTLKALLPSLGDSFHDVCENVREAFCHLLKKLNALEGFHYWDVVPLDHLLSRLEQDTASICDLIVKLTCNNYLPPNKPQGLQLERSIFLFSSNPIAARIYIRHWCLLSDLDIVVSFMKLWYRTLQSFVVQADEESMSSDSSSPADDHVNLDSSPLNDPVIMAGVMDALLISWKTIQHLINLDENQAKKKSLLQLFEKSMAKVLMFFKKSPASVWSPLLLLSSSLKLDSLLTHFGRCMSCLHNLNEESCNRPWDFSAVVGSLVYMGRGKQLLELVFEWMSKGILGPASKENSSPVLQPSNSNSVKVRRTKKHVCFEEKPPKPRLALAILAFVLRYPELQRRIITDNSTFILEELLPLFNSIQEIISHHLVVSEGLPCPKEVLIQAFNLHMHMIILLHRKEDTDVVRSVERVMLWVSSDVVTKLGAPVPNTEQENTRPKTRSSKRKRMITMEDSPLSLQLVKTFLNHISDMLLLGVFDEDFLSAICNFISSLIKTERGSSFLDVLCRILAVLVDQMMLNQLAPSGESVSLISNILSNIIWKLGASAAQETSHMNLIVCRRPLSQSLRTMFHHFGSDQVLTSELLALLLASVMADLGKSISKMEPGDMSELPEAPSLTTFILNHLIGRSHSSKLFKELAHFLHSGSLREPVQILSVVCCFHHALGSIVEKTDCDEMKEAICAAAPVLLQIAHSVKERFSQEDHFHQIPQVLFCKCAQKLLKDVKMEVGLT